MRIGELIAKNKQFISLEFFPPKQKDDWPGFYEQAEKLSSLAPLFVSVTYGAGGGTQENSLEIIRHLSQELKFTVMAHLTCVGATADFLRGFLRELKAMGVRNVLALRGDPPKDAGPDYAPGEFAYATDLIRFIKREFPEFCLGAAGYPEIHPEAASAQSDLKFLREKCALGAEFVITQLFFANRLYYDFAQRCRAEGIGVPVLPGVLPVLNLGALKRITGLCGASIPAELLQRLEQAEASGEAAAVPQVGKAWARQQCLDLLRNGAPGVHLYTLNKSEACLEIAGGLIA